MPTFDKANAWRHSFLNRTQQVTLLKIATQAFNAELAAGRIVIPTGVSKSAALSTWRHGQQSGLGLPASLTMCTQEHYRTLKGHFSNLTGSPAGAAVAYRNFTKSGKAHGRSEISDTHEARELWTNKVIEICKQAGLHYPSYVETICIRQFKKSFTAATADERRALFFTVTTRARKKLAASPPEIVPQENCPF